MVGYLGIYAFLLLCEGELAWGRRVGQAKVQIVFLAADAHLTQIEVALLLYARPKVSAHMQIKLSLTALAATCKLVVAVA